MTESMVNPEAQQFTLVNMSVPEALPLAVLFGGRSEEHDVSLQSAKTVIDNLDPRKYQVHLVGITRQGGWLGSEASARLLEGKDPQEEGGAPFLPPGIECVFPVLHGPYGEDGLIQGWLELLDVPFVGSDSVGSQLAMDKILSKVVLRYNGIQVPSWAEVTREEYAADPADAIHRALVRGVPSFVKPNRLGSSVGISRVADEAEMAAALELALEHDKRVLIEPEIDGREFEVAVLDGEPMIISEPGEIVSDSWYDYKSKYKDDSAELIAPVEDLHKSARIKMMNVAGEAFRLLRLSGLARVDFRVKSHCGRVYLNEVNSMPGFTSISMYPRLMGLAGVPLPAQLDKLIRIAMHGRSRNSSPKTKQAAV
jgi:D-alanine-D-alanine ligase